MNKRKLIAATAAMLLFSSPEKAFAVFPVSVVADASFERWALLWPTFTVGLSTSLSTMNANLINIGGAINANSQQISGSIESASEAQRSLSISQENNNRLLAARQKSRVPLSICVESASGGASTASAAAVQSRTAIEGGGGGASLTTLSKAANALINGSENNSDISSVQTLAASSQFCSESDYKKYGGTKICPQQNTELPSADKRIASILVGAGKYGKSDDATFSQQQADVARLYVQNSTRRNIGRDLDKADADTIDGQRYMGLRTQYQSIISAAEQPALEAIADRMPIPETKSFIRDALETPSARSYWNATASPEAKRNGTVSRYELQKFEVGRRYGNIAYVQDLQALNSDNLIREQIRVASLNSQLLLEIKMKLEEGNIISGQELASKARQEYEPSLNRLLSSIYDKN